MNQIKKDANEANKKKKEECRKPYSKPYLEKLGDLRSLTLGASLGFLDFSAGERSTP